MLIIIIGLPYFAKKLKTDLANFDIENRYVFCDTYSFLFDKIKFATLIPFADIVISLNGVSDKSGSLDLALKFNKKIIMLWQGTDVLLAQKRYKSNTILLKYIEKSIHFSDSFLLINELKGIRIKTDILHFKHIVINNSTIDKYEKISVYTYILEGKEKFYGLDILSPIFAEFSDIEFKILGTKGNSYPKLPNVTYYGWVDANLYKEIANSTPIFIRLTEHDGYSKSVLEALSFGSEVIWNFEHELCHLVKRDSIDLSNKLSDTIKIIKNRNMLKNEKNISWIKENFNFKKIMKNFKHTIEQSTK